MQTTTTTFNHPQIPISSLQAKSMESQSPSNTIQVSSSLPDCLLPTQPPLLRLLLHPVASGCFGALGPFFNKQMGLGHYSNDSVLWKWVLNTQANLAVLWGLDLVFLVMMLAVNTLSVKHKMLSFKQAGSFLSTTIIFSVSVIISLLLDLLIATTTEEEFDISKGFKKGLALILIISGVFLISSESHQKDVTRGDKPSECNKEKAAKEIGVNRSAWAPQLDENSVLPSSGHNTTVVQIAAAEAIFQSCLQGHELVLQSSL